MTTLVVQLLQSMCIKTSISKGYIRFNIYSIPSGLFLPSHLNMLEQGTKPPPNSPPLVLDIPKFTNFR